MRTVLILAAETGVAFAMTRSLRQAWGDGIRIVTGDSEPREFVTASLYSDCHIQTPRIVSTEFPRAVGEILASDEITDYSALTDSELVALDEIALSSERPRIWACEGAGSLTYDKSLVIRFLSDLGIPVPRTYDVSELPQTGRFFVKPRRGNGSRDCRTMSVGEIRDLSEETAASLILQDVCDPPEVTVDSFHDSVSGHHRSLVRERLATRMGVSISARLYDDHELTDYARRIGQALRQRGSLCFQAMRSGGRWVVTDLNLRPGAGTSMAKAAGIDFFAATAACRWGEPVDPFISASLPEAGIHVTRQYADYPMP